MNVHPNELPIPPKAVDEPRAVELLRVWAACGKQHVTLATGLWDDPACCGLMLVDLAKHIAIAYEQTNGQNRNSVLQRIKDGLDAEWGWPTGEPHGKLLEE